MVRIDLNESEEQNTPLDCLVGARYLGGLKPSIQDALSLQS